MVAVLMACYNPFMTEKQEIEPGLLMVFRGFMSILSAIHLLDGLIVLIHALFQRPYQPHHINRSNLAIGINIINYGFLLVFTWWKPVRDYFGRYFLTIGLILATATPILVDKINILGIQQAMGVEVFLLLNSWDSILAMELLLPLILTAWQYSCSIVVIYCLATAFLDLTSMYGVLGAHSQFFPPLVKTILIRTVFFIAIGLITNQLVSEQRKQRQALASANRELTAYAVTQEKLAVSRERNRLARDFHDTLAHTLSSITVELEAVKTLLESDLPEAERILERTQSAAREGLVETRRTLRALKPVLLEDLGFSLAVKRLAEETAEINNLVLDWHCSCPGEDLLPEIEKGFFGIAQEALTNAARHAKAARLTVLLEKTAHGLRLEVCDDGRGFDPQSAPSTDHFGLQGMRERARLIGADLQIKSAVGAGTRVLLCWENAHA